MPAKKKAAASKPAARRPASNGTVFAVSIGRFGSEPVTIKVKTGSTVAQVLAQASIELGSTERVWLNGAKVAGSAHVKPGDLIAIVSPKQAGVR